ncbi:SdpI family protein [Longimicrobium sp.]|uniref:SdpI family protein n=1 Tax=Longimicrobium sp. TaxID=2029185 RepID=UPI002CF9C422|nr:SdpI family protein [Longimicrobium sp.]HSU14825.1 SdpI family protein [Longimicrobium sp.]
MKNRWITAALLAALWVFAAVAYPRLPARIPTHWNVRGQADGWGGPASAFLFPAIATGIALLLHLLPRIDPRRAHWDKFRDEMGLIVMLVVLFLGWIQTVALGSALGWKLDMTRSVLVGMGLFLAAIGNYLPRIRSNWWMGIRTPWTLESERVWRETHRVGGRVFVLAGLAVAAAAFLPEPFCPAVPIAAMGAAGLVPVVYSYVAWRRESAHRAG